VDDANCNNGCSGYGQQACGGVNFWTVYNTGLILSVEYSPDDTSQPSPSTSQPAVVTVGGGPTVVVTEPPSSQQSNPNGGSNVAGIAAGVVVGVVVIAGILGAVLFYLRRKRNREIEDEHRRNAAANSIVNGSKPPGNKGGQSAPDSRMDPVMAHRRMSDGSIADNQDYSRKILRVSSAPSFTKNP
jgi:cell wall integrity and stress response component